MKIRILLCIGLVGCGHKLPVPNEGLTDMQVMLAEHCENQKGVMAFTTSPEGKFATCHNKKSLRKIWTTRL